MKKQKSSEHGNLRVYVNRFMVKDLCPPLIHVYSSREKRRVAEVKAFSYVFEKLRQGKYIVFIIQVTDKKTLRTIAARQIEVKPSFTVDIFLPEL